MRRARRIGVECDSGIPASRHSAVDLPQTTPCRAGLRAGGAWLARPNVRIVQEADEHMRLLRALLAETEAAGNLTSDKHLAALALSHGATLVSFDNDFARFP